MAQTVALGGPGWPPGVPARAIGTLIGRRAPGQGAAGRGHRLWAAVMPPAHPGAAVVSVLADHTRSVRRLLDQALGELSPRRPP